jgi:hypothetical protein
VNGIDADKAARHHPSAFAWRLDFSGRESGAEEAWAGKDDDSGENEESLLSNHGRPLLFLFDPRRVRMRRQLYGQFSGKLH